MLIARLNPAEISQVYHEHLKRDFPSDELKPLFVIKGHLKNNFYQAFGLFDQPADGSTPDLSGLVAYAYLCGCPTGGLLLLDYFAVVPGSRSQGLGSSFLAQLCHELHLADGLVAEVESVEAARTDEERVVRQRRLNFYLQADFQRSAVQGRIFGVDYRIVYQPLGSQLDNTALLAAVIQLYRDMLPRLLFRQQIHLFQDQA